MERGKGEQSSSKELKSTKEILEPAGHDVKLGKEETWLEPRTQEISSKKMIRYHEKGLGHLGALESKRNKSKVELESSRQKLETKKVELESERQKLETKKVKLESKRPWLETREVELESKTQKLEAKKVELESKRQKLEIRKVELESEEKMVRDNVNSLESRITKLKDERRVFEMKRFDYKDSKVELEEDDTARKPKDKQLDMNESTQMGMTLASRDWELEFQKEYFEFQKEKSELQNEKLELQNEELELQNEELELQNEELEFQKEYFEFQKEKLELQNEEFEWLKEEEGLMKFEVERKDLKEQKSGLREVQLEETIHRRRDDTHAQTAHGRSVVTQNIFVIGGVGQDGEILRTVEEYIFRGGEWVPMPGMNTPRSFMSSVIVGNEIVVSGGDTGAEITDTIETLNLGKTPLRWTTSSARLPVPLSGHQTVVYQGKLIAIGGHNGDEGFNSDKIYEVCLTPPYSTNILCFMPQPRAGHGAELIGDEIFIFGGTRNVSAPNNEVLVYNLVTREFRVMESLPYAVHGMATVRQSGIVILCGGIDQNGGELDQVITYNIQSGENNPLPSMMEKRGSCCAVRSVMPDSIAGCSSDETTEALVALGSLRDIKTTECYDFRSQKWKGMPSLTFPRKYSTMVASPTEFNFV